MMLLPIDFGRRREEVLNTPHLTALADGLSQDLEGMRQAVALPIPEGKARLTRLGGRCPQHGVLLEFDPWSPVQHRCPRCGVAYTEPEHHDWWAMNAQLYVAERAVHAAALAWLREDERDRELARRILGELSARYLEWPNRDNVLGPTRPFFSTYLESIWLVNVCHAVALLEAVSPLAEADTVRANLLEPSSTLIATYHEGRSNRQVWNEVAILSAWTLLGERTRCERRLDGAGSLAQLLSQGLLDDGTWYEGENYHMFAHRGLWYGVQLLRAVGRPLAPDAEARFHAGFIAPFTGLLPDETLPSRRDSQYRTSIRQWRTAEHLELGWAMTGDVRIAGLLQRLYDGTVTRRSMARSYSTADAERNEPAMALTRADGSWRALLMASADPLPEAVWQPTSVLQPRQGVAILRRERGQVYVALEGGETGGGHGHPDRLALTLQIGEGRWLDDPGTGSYVESTLHWYRSTIAHHAPLIDGASQRLVPAQLVAYEDRDGAGWICKRAQGIAPGVQCTRTVVVCDGYLVDQLEWEANREIRLTLPIAADLQGDPSVHGQWMPASFDLAAGLEDGAAFVEDPRQWVSLDPQSTWTASVAPAANSDSTSRLMRWWGHVHGVAPSDVRLLRATVPGAPGSQRAPRHLIEARGATGAIRSVWSWSRSPNAASIVSDVSWPSEGEAVAVVTTDDGTIATHQPAPHGWHIALTARHARSSIDLEGVCQPTGMMLQGDTSVDVEPGAGRDNDRVAVRGSDVVDLGPDHPAVWSLGAAHYIQTEEPWGGSNTPLADVTATLTAQHLVIHLEVTTGHAVMGPGGSPAVMPDNPLDNERADINADGVQVYLGRAESGWRCGYLCVPLPDGTVRVTALHVEAHHPAAAPNVRATPRATNDGWAMTIEWARTALEPMGHIAQAQCSLPFDLVVNERPPERERRRGQLALTGGGGFGYLRGDRHASAHPLVLRFPAHEDRLSPNPLSSAHG